MGPPWEPVQHLKRHSEFWSSSISSISLASQASLSSLSTLSQQSIISTSSGGVSGTITGGIATITSTFTSDGSTIVSTITSTTLSPTSTSGGDGSQSQSYSGTYSSTSSSFMSSSSLSAAPTPTQFQVGAADQAVCAGHGLDTQAIGVLTTLIFSAAVGFIIWVCVFTRRPHNTIDILHNTSLSTIPPC